MKINDGFEELRRLRMMLKEHKPEMVFDFREVARWDGPFKEWFRKEVPGKNASKENGIYFIADAEENILYIGKAGAENLGAEIWGKFSAPNEKGQFNSPFAEEAPGERLRDAIINGDILIAAAVIHPGELVSLAEVYLQIRCKINDGNLPVLNKRIG